MWSSLLAREVGAVDRITVAVLVVVRRPPLHGLCTAAGTFGLLKCWRDPFVSLRSSYLGWSKAFRPRAASPCARVGTSCQKEPDRLSGTVLGRCEKGGPPGFLVHGFLQYGAASEKELKELDIFSCRCGLKREGESSLIWIGTFIEKALDFGTVLVCDGAH